MSSVAPHHRAEYSESDQIQSLHLETESEAADPGKMQSLSSQIAFGSDTLRPSISFDCLGTVYDQHFSTRVSHSHKVWIRERGGFLTIGFKISFLRICLLY